MRHSELSPADGGDFGHETSGGCETILQPVNHLASTTPVMGEAQWSYSGRYCDQPMDWRTRMFGFGGTTLIAGLLLVTTVVTWMAVAPPQIVQSSEPLVVELLPLEAPPKPVREVAPGPEQVEKQETVSDPEPMIQPPPLVKFPLQGSISEPREPVEIVDPGPAVPETTAPRSIAAPEGRQLANDAKPDWEALLLAHLERFRRYPARARAARQQGTVYIRFTMNRAGQVLSSAIARKSGFFALDRAALDTLKRAQPLPAIPKDRPDVLELTIPVEFYLR